MEFFLLPLSNSLLLGLAAGAFSFFAIWRLRRRRQRMGKNNSYSKSKKITPPEVAGAWPVLGHLRRLSSRKQPLVRTLAELADRYGPIFTIRVGMQPAVIISSWETARDCFSTNDKLLADRPPNCAGKYMGYDYAVLPFALYGPFWREMRKLVVVELLSNHTLDKLRPVWMSELGANLRELQIAAAESAAPKAAAAVDMSQWFGHLTLNLIVTLIAGRRYRYRPNSAAAEEEGEEARCMTKVFKEIMRLVGELAPGDWFYPTRLVRGLDLGGQIASMKRVSKAMDHILEGWIEEHVERRRRSADDGNREDDRDFIDVMLSVIDRKFHSGGHPYSRETIIKAASLSMLEDAADTLGLNMEWVLSLLLNHPQAMKRAREEIDDAVAGKQRWAEESDIDKMPYLQAAVKEGMRLYPAAPLLVPHRAMEDCIVGGYTVPKGTVLYANAWKIHRDPRVWPDPERFSPERFLEGSGGCDDDPSRHFGYIPFGIGRRSCPGMSYALKVTRLTLARLLQGFEIATPANLPVDMSEGQATTLPRATPLEVHITPRFPSFFYQDF